MTLQFDRRESFRSLSQACQVPYNLQTMWIVIGIYNIFAASKLTHPPKNKSQGLFYINTGGEHVARAPLLPVKFPFCPKMKEYQAEICRKQSLGSSKYKYFLGKEPDTHHTEKVYTS